MAEDKGIIPIKNLGIYGVIRQAEVDDNLIPEGGVVAAINVDFDRKGAIKRRNGETAIGGQIVDNGVCYGVYNAMFSNSGSNRVISVFSNGSNNVCRIYQNGTWLASLGGDTTGLKTRFATFADNIIRVNGTDAMKCWDGGSAWTTTGNPINVNSMSSYPTKFIDVFKNRVYTAGYSSNPDRLYFSSIISTSGNITWTPTTDYVDINPNDGENITGLKRFSLELLIFKPNYIYRFRTEAIDPDPLIKIGTRSNESIVEGKLGLYFHHDTGFYQYAGATPKEISKPISDFIEAIPLSYYQNIVGWRDNDHVYWSVGDLTVDGISYSNVVVRYTESSEVWTVRSYPTEIRWATDFNDGTTLFRVVGDDDGYILKVDNGNSDNGTAISYNFITKWYYFNSNAERKVLNEMVILCEKSQGTKVLYQIDGESNWESLGRLEKFRTKFSQLNIKFHRIRFKVIGISDKEGMIFQGWEITNLNNEGIVD